MGGVRRTAARLNSLVSMDAAVSLSTLADCYGVTKRAVLEAVLASAIHEAERYAINTTGSAAGLYTGQVHLDKALLLHNAKAED